MESRDHVLYVFEGSKLILRLDHSSIDVPEETEAQYRELEEVFGQAPHTEWSGKSYRVSADQSRVIATDSQGHESVVIELPAVNTTEKTFGLLTFLALVALIVFWNPETWEETDIPPRRLHNRVR